MDEPMANLDYGNQVRILHTIHALAQQRYSILLTSHVPDHAFLVCNQVGLLDERTAARTRSSSGNHHRRMPSVNCMIHRCE